MDVDRASLASPEPAPAPGARAGRARAERRGPSGSVRLCGRACVLNRRLTPPTPAGPAAVAPGQFRSGGSLHEGRLRGPGVARCGGQRPGRTHGARMGLAARRATPVLRLARRVPRGSSELAKPGLDSRTAGSRSLRASPGAGDGRRFFRERAAAIERGQDRRGARRCGARPRRGRVGNHPQPVAGGQSRRPDRERRAARVRRFAREGRPRLSRRAPGLRRLSQRRGARRRPRRPGRLWRSPRPASRRRARR